MNKIYNQFDIETIEKLADIVKSKDLGEIFIKNGDCEITVKGKKCPPPPMSMTAMPMTAPSVSAQAAEVPSNMAETEVISGNQVKAPIVGTFYSAPSPTEKPFVSVGDTVKKGDVLFIIESMKVMNEVQSEFDGVVKKVLANSGDAVEFDQTVMIIG